jgi:hypothetical protein
LLGVRVSAVDLKSAVDLSDRWIKSSMSHGYICALIAIAAYYYRRVRKSSQKHLEKLPYKFSYVFRCADSGGKVHTAMIEDWELGVLYRREVERLGDEQAAVANVRKKFFDEICGPSRDTRWVVIGVFWPPREFQPTLI